MENNQPRIIARLIMWMNQDSTRLSFLSIIFAAVTLTHFILTRRRRRNPRGLPRPPGPKGWPVIGNLFDVPSQNQYPWLVYRDWTADYGDMIYYELLGQPFLVLNSLKRVNDLLDKRATNYSNRPRSTMMLDLMRLDFNFALLPYGAMWRKYRRIFHENFNSSSLQTYRPIQLDEVRTLALRLAEDPTAEKLFANIRRSYAGTIMRIAYGSPVTSENDENIERAEIALDGVSQAAIPGAFLVDFFPILKHVPSWMAGASFQRKAAYWRSVNEDLCSIPYNVVKDQLAAGTASESVAAQLIAKLPHEWSPDFAEAERMAQGTAAISYKAGVDTTVSILQAFFVTIAKHPEVLAKAQAELDRVVGRDRVPNFEDRESLPYIQALCKEVLRYHQTLPLGFPHSTSEDDEYDGYFIPKGTIVLPNAWAILHDPEVFEAPLEFNPDRYMKDGQFNKALLDPASCGTFGFGRRMCPGRFLSESSLYATISILLSLFNITSPSHRKGEKAPPLAITSGTFSYPVPIDWEIKLRDEIAVAMLKEMAAVDA